MKRFTNMSYGDMLKMAIELMFGCIVLLIIVLLGIIFILNQGC